MRPISWLHVSDFHLRDSQAWAQDVVLRAMCKDIERCRRDIDKIDFVLATGDLAFAGKPHEYKRASAFFDELARVAEVPRERIYCVPGNHDVDRDRQRLCFAGARHLLQSENEVDLFLGLSDEIGTLLERQKAYRAFQECYFTDQERTWTANGLGYVSTVTIDDLKIAIVGINTAWLSEGGISDHGKLIAGERQIIDVLQLAAEADAHLVVAMGHHPFHLLNDFDRRPVQERVEEACHFFHCGHLHDPEARAVHSGAHCLTVAAGATFETRQSHNAFSIVSLDIMKAHQSIRTVQYKPTEGKFSFEKETVLPFTINSVQPYSIAELGSAIASFSSELAPIAHYLSALLTEAQAEMPIAIGDAFVFGSYDLVRDQAADVLKTASVDFMAMRNPLRLFAGKLPLHEFMSRYGDRIQRYGTLLNEIAHSEPEVSAKLTERNADARTLAGVEPLQPFTHSLNLLRELANGHDWSTLRQYAERYLDSAEPALAVEAQRMLGLSLAQSHDAADQAQAIATFKILIESERSIPSDFAALASLQIAAADYKAAKATLVIGIEKFPGHGAAFQTVGQTLIEATGDRDLRKKLVGLQEKGGQA